jgi:hypothetical protein
MNGATKTAQHIRRAIEEMARGEPFTSSAFLALGSRAAVDHALSRFVRLGLVARVARGVFARPKVSKYVGPVLPSPEAVARAVAGRAGAKVQPSGAEAAAEMHLSTQRPVAPVFHTSGPTRRFRMGALEVTLKHVSPRRLALAGRPAGTALAALWYLGKGEVNEAVIEQVRKRLPAEEFQALRGATSSQPGWMVEAFRRHERGAHRG